MYCEVWTDEQSPGYDVGGGTRGGEGRRLSDVWHQASFGAETERRQGNDAAYRRSQHSGMYFLVAYINFLMLLFTSLSQAAR